MKRMKTRLAAAAMALVVTVPFWMNSTPAHGVVGTPSRVLIVVFDQMIPKYADEFNMVNFRELRGDGTYFKNAYLGYMASETVISHNVIVSGQLPKNMGWVDEAYRDAGSLLDPANPAPPAQGEMHITGDLSLGNYGTLVTNADYLKLTNYLRSAYPDKKFMMVGEKSYAVETAMAPATGTDIGVRLSGRKTVTTAGPGGCIADVGGRFRYPQGYNVPSYLLEPDASDSTKCGRFTINSDKGNDYGTKAAFPSWIYPEDGNRFFPGTDASAAGHPGGDVWATDAAIAMIEHEDWSGLFVTLGAIDKAGHMWGAQEDAANFTGDCNDPEPAVRGANQTHIRCAAEIADAQLGRLRTAVAAYDVAHGGETLIVLTSDHGGTYSKSFNGKNYLDAGDSNWYYGSSVYDGGLLVTTTYNNPSPALQPLIATGNVQFSYQSTAIETWLLDNSDAKKMEAAAIAQTLPGVMASYWHNGDGYTLYGRNRTPASELRWWRAHGQEIVDTLAAPNGPDVVALLHDRVGYGAYGDHGGAQESVQRVPVVFWSPSLAAHQQMSGGFRTIDILPTILEAMDIPVSPTDTMDGAAWTIT